MPAARTPLNSVNLRLPKHMLQRADSLRRVAEAAPELATLPNVTRSDVLRLAVLRGLEALEAAYEAVVDDELAEEAERRIADPANQERIPLETVLKRHGV